MRGAVLLVLTLALGPALLGGSVVQAQTTTLAPPTTATPPPAVAPPPTTQAPATTRAPASTAPRVTTTLLRTTVAPVANDAASESTLVVLVALAAVAVALLIAVIVSRAHQNREHEMAATGWRGEAVRAHGDASVLRDLVGGPDLLDSRGDSDDSWWTAVGRRADAVDRRLATLEATAPEPAATGAATAVRRSMRSLLYAA